MEPNFLSTGNWSGGIETDEGYSEKVLDNQAEKYEGNSALVACLVLLLLFSRHLGVWGVLKISLVARIGYGAWDFSIKSSRKRVSRTNPSSCEAGKSWFSCEDALCSWNSIPGCSKREGPFSSDETTIKWDVSSWCEDTSYLSRKAYFWW